MSSSAVMSLAKQIANAQGRLALSPAETDESGQVVLCAASCIAKAAMIINGHADEAEKFISQVAASDKNVYLPDLFSSYGIGISAREVLCENDNTPPEDRLSWFNAL